MDHVAEKVSRFLFDPHYDGDTGSDEGDARRVDEVVRRFLAEKEGRPEWPMKSAETGIIWIVRVFPWAVAKGSRHSAASVMRTSAIVQGGMEGPARLNGDENAPRQQSASSSSARVRCVPVTAVSCGADWIS